MSNLNKQLYDEKKAGSTFTVATLINTFITLVFSFIVLGSGVNVKNGEVYQDWYLYISYILPQLAFFLTVVFFFLTTKQTVKEVYAPCKWYYFLLAVFVQFGLFSLSEVNNLFLSFLYKNTGYVGGMSLPNVSGANIIPVILTVALLPAVLEETVFRGLILRPLKDFSTPLAVLLSGVLFALYHQRPDQTFYQFFCGCAFALIAIRSGSVLPTMVSHFLNNAVILILYACGINDMGGLSFYICSGVALVIGVTLLVLDKKTNTKKTKSLTPFLLGATGGIAVCLLFWISALISGIQG